MIGNVTWKNVPKHFEKGGKAHRLARMDGIRLRPSKPGGGRKDADCKKPKKVMSADAIADAKAILKDATPKAIEKLIGLLSSKDERIVFSTAREILDRQLGKPGIMMENDINQRITISWASPQDGHDVGHEQTAKLLDGDVVAEAG